MPPPAQTNLDDVIILLTKIEQNQRAAAKFNVGTALSVALAGAFIFILALALNAFLQAAFAMIPVGTGLPGLAIYAIIAIIMCLGALFLIYVYLQPWLQARFKFAEK